MARRAHLAAAAAVAATVVAAGAYYGEASEQERLAGARFGNTMLDIQDDLKSHQDALALRVSAWRDGRLAGADLAAHIGEHEAAMEETIQRYAGLRPPPGFAPSVELFEMSARAQLESDLELARFALTGDEAHRIRSDSLLGSAFAYEAGALASYAAAQSGAGT